MKLFSFTSVVRALSLAAMLVAVGAVGGAFAERPKELLGEWVHSTYYNTILDLRKDGTGSYDRRELTSWEAVDGKNLEWTWTDSKNKCSLRYTLSDDGFKIESLACTFLEGKFVPKAKVAELKKKAEEEKKAAFERLKAIGEENMKKSTYFTDARDGKKYRAVKIGTQTWMAQNLNYKAAKSECSDNDEGYCKDYGRLYNWATAKTACPAGYHLPTVKEFEKLVETMNKEAGEDGKKVESLMKSTSGWETMQEENGPDPFAFSALPAVSQNGSSGSWWTATPSPAVDKGKAYPWGMYGENYENPMRTYSVRCVK
jgi:uncharacterized protein (TIGR02145 family)